MDKAYSRSGRSTRWSKEICTYLEPLPRIKSCVTLSIVTCLGAARFSRCDRLSLGRLYLIVISKANLFIAPVRTKPLIHHYPRRRIPHPRYVYSLQRVRRPSEAQQGRTRHRRLRVQLSTTRLTWTRTLQGVRAAVFDRHYRLWP